MCAEPRGDLGDIDVLTAQRHGVGPKEWAAREELRRIGFTWFPCYPNSKVQRQDLGLWRKIPYGNAHAYLPVGVFALDVDGSEGRARFDELHAWLGPTLMFRARRGPKLVYRLPPGLDIKADQALAPGLELITEKFLAPGSTYGGVYYAVEVLREVTVVPIEQALLLPGVFEAAAAPTRGVQLIVREHRWSPNQRRARAGAMSVVGAVSDGAASRRAEWLAETRRGFRGRALLQVACQMIRFDEPFDDFVEAVQVSPVAVKLQGKGDPRRWLHMIWQKAERVIASSSEPRARARASSTSEILQAHGKPVEALAWYEHAITVLGSRYPDGGTRYDRLVALVGLHANFIAVYGTSYHLGRAITREYLGGIGNKLADQVRELLIEYGLLSRDDEKRTHQEQELWWCPLLDGQALGACSVELSQISDTVLDEFPWITADEIDALRVATRHREDAAYASWRERAARRVAEERGTWPKATDI